MKRLRWNIGIAILRFGYWIRGEVPQKTWGIYKKKDVVVFDASKLADQVRAIDNEFDKWNR